MKMEKTGKVHPAIMPMTEMECPNQPIEIHKGSVNLRYNNKTIETTSGIVFKWLPTPRVQISGETDDTVILGRAIVSLQNSIVGEAMINNLRTSTASSSTSFSGRNNSKIVFGDKGQPVEHILFEVANLRDFMGDTITTETKTQTQMRTQMRRGRLDLYNDDYEISIEKNQNSENLHKKLKDEGGYILLYSGKIISKKGILITFEESKNLCDCLSHFFFFLNGRRCSPLFRRGFSGETEVWADYTPYFTDPYQYDVSTWPQAFGTDGLNEIWVKFYQLWQDESEREVLKTALHWYVEANSNAGFVEGSLTMIQNALELLFNWILIENQTDTSDNGLDRIQASDKIGRLLSHCNIKPEIPFSFEELKALATANEDTIKTGPKAITYIRNRIVHPKREYREQFKKISNGAKRESLQLGLWYVELILLHYLDYKGKYSNRCSGAKSGGEGEEFVPWCQE